MEDELKIIPKELAHQHSEWFAEITKEIYKTAFLHGFKHGVEYEKSCQRSKK